MMMEPSNEDFRTFHRYSKLVRRGLVQPLKCSCGNTYVTALGEEDQLVLRCFTCGTDRVPGEGTKDNVRAVVKEHFLSD